LVYQEVIMNSPFSKGDINPVSMYFTGKSYLAALSEDQVQIFNVTFTPGCRNFWHIHHADQGGGQVLLCTYGRGWYQQWGCEPRELHPGDVVNIPAGVKHWHGAAKDSEFAHIAIEVPGEGYRTQWCEPVTDAEYDKLK
jgi:quercetin dioxygenase-like cupin family protein